MSIPSRDNFGNWCKFVFGSFFFCAGASELFQFAAHDQVSFGPSRSFPIHLTGESAALVYVLYVAIGALTCVSGIKGLLSK